MKCPFCGALKDRVLESRKVNGGRAVRRRRVCKKCQGRFTSYEKIEERPLLVIKKDGRKERFNREKIMSGILRACEKRPVSIKSVEQVIDEVEREIHEKMGREVSAIKIGELVMKKLRRLDQVAYVRFASVYREFKDVKDFIKEISKFRR